MIVTMTDGGDKIILAWDVPLDNRQAFLAAVDRAAIEAGGAALTEVDLGNPTRPCESEMTRAALEMLDDIG